MPITDFELITAPLTENELKLVPVFIKALAEHIGKKNAVPSTRIIEGLKKRGTKITGATVRKVISHVRAFELLDGLMACEKGYYVTRDPAEVKGWLESIDGRIRALETLKRTGKKYLQSLVNQQASKLNFPEQYQ